MAIRFPLSCIAYNSVNKISHFFLFFFLFFLFGVLRQHSSRSICISISDSGANVDIIISVPEGPTLYSSNLILRTLDFVQRNVITIIQGLRLMSQPYLHVSVSVSPHLTISLLCHKKNVSFRI